jgi:hypothetical protein
MTTVNLNTTIESTFATSWGSTTTVAFENVAYTPPVDASWVKIYVKDGDSQKISLGKAPQRRRTLGTVFVDIFTVIGQGSKPARTLADSVKAVFRDLRVGGIFFYEGDVTIFGERYYTNSGTGVPATSQWYQAVVAIPFFMDETV